MIQALDLARENAMLKDEVDRLRRELAESGQTNRGEPPGSSGIPWPDDFASSALRFSFSASFRWKAPGLYELKLVKGAVNSCRHTQSARQLVTATHCVTFNARC